MSLNPLDNPLERLGVLPNAMNWRGGWDITEQYYLNDVVVSPISTASYILSGPTTLLGGQDPSINAVDWTELSNPTTGVTSVSGSAYIGVVGTTNVTITNNGVRTLATGTGIANVGSANNVSLINTGITSLNAGLGIGVAGNTITNTGIRTLAVNPAGLTSSGGSDPTISNTGILTLTAGNAGITITGGQTATITNSGILGITAGSGLTSTGGQNPTLAVTSVQPVITNIAAGLNITPDPATIPCPSGGTASYVMAMTSPSVFATQLATTGTPDPNGVWFFEMSNFDVFIYGAPSIGLNRNLSVSFWDTGTAGGPYSYTPFGSAIYFYPTQPLPINTDLGAFVFDLNAARAAGMRQLNEIRIFNNTDGTLEPQGWGSIYATYYPNGVQ
jgi:hypothetical protein